MCSTPVQRRSRLELPLRVYWQFAKELGAYWLQFITYVKADQRWRRGEGANVSHQVLLQHPCAFLPQAEVK